MIGLILKYINTRPIIVKYEHGHLRYGLRFYSLFLHNLTFQIKKLPTTEGIFKREIFTGRCGNFEKFEQKFNFWCKGK